MSIGMDEIRNIDRLISQIGDVASRQGPENVGEICNEAIRVIGRLRTKPSCDDCQDLINRLRAFENLSGTSLGSMRFMQMKAGMAIATAKALFDQLAPQESDAEDSAGSAWQIIKWPDLIGKTAPTRKFILPDWIPANCITLLHGYGGAGKSLLAQQIGTAAAFQRELLGGVVDACPVLGWFGEDEYNELWRRQECINDALDVDMADLEDKLIWRPCPGDDITLFKATSESDYQTTPVFDALRDQIREYSAKLIILDSATQIAAVSEISRTLVTRCLQALNSLCIEFDTTILLLGHNNRGGDFSGSSAWENRVRSRMHLKRSKDEDGTDRTVLCRPKANYAATEEGVSLEWREGAYRCTEPKFETYGDRLDRELRNGAANQAFLDALDKLTAQRRATSASKKAGSSYAPRMMVDAGLAGGPKPNGNLEEINGFCAPFTVRELEGAMSRLFTADRIVADALLWKRPNRHTVYGIGRKI